MKLAGHVPRIKNVTLSYTLLHPLIVFIFGCMRSGKTEELFNQLHAAITQRGATKVIIFKPREDDRSEGVISSRAYTETCSAITLTEAEQARFYIQEESCVIAFDEAQFYKGDLAAVCKDLFNKNHLVIVSGLDKVHNGDQWPYMEAMLDVAHVKIQRAGSCEGRGGVCRGDAVYSYRLSGSSATIETGDEGYVVLCEACHKQVVKSERRIAV